MDPSSKKGVVFGKNRCWEHLLNTIEGAPFHFELDEKLKLILLHLIHNCEVLQEMKHKNLMKKDISISRLDMKHGMNVIVAYLCMALHDIHKTAIVLVCSSVHLTQHLPC